MSIFKRVWRTLTYQNDAHFKMGANGRPEHKRVGQLIDEGMDIFNENDVTNMYVLGREHALDELEEWFLNGGLTYPNAVMDYIRDEREILEGVKHCV